MNTTPFLNSIRSSNKQEVRNLIKEGFDINELKNYRFVHTKETALHFACSIGNNEMVEMLVNEGHADINSVSSKGLTPLMCECEFEIFKFLVLKGANLGIRDSFERNILNLLCEDEDLIAVEFLLKNTNAIVVCENENHTSSFLYACMKCNLEIAELLINHGADINTVDRQGNNCLIKVLTGRYFNDEDEPDYLSFMKFLITEGADPYMKNSSGKTCIDFLHFESDMKNELIKFIKSVKNVNLKPAKW
jgi:ankyrin repeat protein